MSLTTTASRPLPRELARGRSSIAPLAVLGGEADERLARRGARAASPRARRRSARARARRRSRPAFLILPSLGAARAEVGDGGRHQQHVAARELLLAGVAAARRRCHVAPARRRRGAAARRWRRPASPRRRARGAASASARPMRPEELLPRKRTLSIGSRVPPAVTSTRSAAPARPRRRRRRRSPAPRRRERRLARRQQPRRLGQAPDAVLALGGQPPDVRARRSCTPRSRSVRRLACVAGCSYMWLFIAGATTQRAVGGERAAA